MARSGEDTHEILSVIILAALPTYWFRSRPFEEKLPASHVCRYWRDICLHTPEIWQRIVYPHLFDDDHLYIDALREYLRRSGSTTLSITLGSYQVQSDVDALKDPQPDIRDVWTLLFAESRRWHSAKFVLDDEVPVPTSLHEALDVPLLEEAGVVCPVDPDFAYPIELSAERPFRWFANALKLRRLCIAEPFFPSLVQVQWQCISHLNLYMSHVTSLQECVAILPHCTALEHLEYTVFAIEPGEQLSVVDVPSLRTLVLTHDAVLLCCHLRTPRLRKLTIIGGPDQSVRVHGAIDMLAQRGPLSELQSLSFGDVFNPVLMGHTLALFPNVIELHITDHHPLHSIPFLWCQLADMPDEGQVKDLQVLSLQLQSSGWVASGLQRLADKALTRWAKLRRLELWNVPEELIKTYAAGVYKQWTAGLEERGVHVEANRRWLHLPRDSIAWD
ncbi:hypothetical protein HDZ31DRAFT_80714 [Schizophyllum fasciatum]